MRQVRAVDTAPHAITDLYDEKRGTFLVQFPAWFVIILALAGVAAFAMTGFFGWMNRPDTTGVDNVFRQPWLLFLWFCAIVITLQVSIFRNQSLRSRLWATLAVSLFCIIFVGITYFNESLPDILRRLLEQGRLLRLIATSTLTYTIVNFGLIAIFWADTIRRWIRRMRGLPPNPGVDIGFGKSGDGEDMPSMTELVSGDLIAGALLTAILSLVFRTDVIGLFVHPQGMAHITDCMVSWPLGACVHGGGPQDPPTLTFLDIIQSLIYLPLGLIILALTATLSGLSAVGGVDDAELEADAPAKAQPGESSTVPIAEDVTATLINTLRSALDRRLRILINNLALSLRMVGWPGLIFLATYGLAELSTGIEGYLHSGRSPEDLIIYVLPAIGWGLLSMFSVVFSAALMLFRWRVAENTLRFLGLIGFILLLTLWIFSLALWGFNQLLLQTHALIRHPFDPPSSPTYISLAALVIFGSLMLFRRMRRPRPPTRAAAPELAGVPSGAPTAGGEPAHEAVPPESPAD
jgi:hypothetical protein